MLPVRALRRAEFLPSPPPARRCCVSIYRKPPDSCRRDVLPPPFLRTRTPPSRTPSASLSTRSARRLSSSSATKSTPSTACSLRPWGTTPTGARRSGSRWCARVAGVLFLRAPRGSALSFCNVLLATRRWLVSQHLPVVSFPVFRSISASAVQQEGPCAILRSERVGGAAAAVQGGTRRRGSRVRRPLFTRPASSPCAARARVQRRLLDAAAHVVSLPLRTHAECRCAVLSNPGAAASATTAPRRRAC